MAKSAKRSKKAVHKKKSSEVVVREFDRGGFGRIEEVRLSNGRHVARKVFDPQIQLSPTALAKFRIRFEREVKVQEQLPTEIALPILRKNLSGDHPWYLMPLAQKNYRRQIEEDRASGAINIHPVADMLNALEALHALGYVHRDLKPENLLLQDKKWKLADFGLVLPLDDDGSNRLTSSTSGWGTQRYMAPEQFREFRNVTPAADIYSVGCILHDLATDGRRVPFSRLTCDGPLGPILEKCTDPDPTRRFPDVRKLRDVLFIALAKPAPLSDQSPASEWMKKLEDVSSWKLGELEGFVKSLQKMDRKSETTTQLLTQIDENALETLNAIDPAVWSQLADVYFEWTRGDFPFEYCDVIATRLHRIFNLANPAQKARAVLAAARLGNTHNRWYVMRHVLNMAGPSLEDAVAQRLAIEIEISDSHDDFISCADGINMTVGSYHPAVATILLKHSKSK